MSLISLFFLYIMVVTDFSALPFDLCYTSLSSIYLIVFLCFPCWSANDDLEEKDKVPRDSNELSGDGNIENMLLVEKGLRELASLKVSGHTLMHEILADVLILVIIISSVYRYHHIICLLLNIFPMEVHT